MVDAPARQRPNNMRRANTLVQAIKPDVASSLRAATYHGAVSVAAPMGQSTSYHGAGGPPRASIKQPSIQRRASLQQPGPAVVTAPVQRSQMQRATLPEKNVIPPARAATFQGAGRESSARRPSWQTKASMAESEVSVTDHRKRDDSVEERRFKLPGSAAFKGPGHGEMVPLDVPERLADQEQEAHDWRLADTLHRRRASDANNGPWLQYAPSIYLSRDGTPRTPSRPVYDRFASDGLSPQRAGDECLPSRQAFTDRACRLREGRGMAGTLQKYADEPTDWAAHGECFCNVCKPYDCRPSGCPSHLVYYNKPRCRAHQDFLPMQLVDERTYCSARVAGAMRHSDLERAPVEDDECFRRSLGAKAVSRSARSLTPLRSGMLPHRAASCDGHVAAGQYNQELKYEIMSYGGRGRHPFQGSPTLRAKSAGNAPSRDLFGRDFRPEPARESRSWQYQQHAPSLSFRRAKSTDALPSPGQFSSPVSSLYQSRQLPGASLASTFSDVGSRENRDPNTLSGTAARHSKSVDNLPSMRSFGLDLGSQLGYKGYSGNRSWHYNQGVGVDQPPRLRSGVALCLDPRIGDPPPPTKIALSKAPGECKYGLSDAAAGHGTYHNQQYFRYADPGPFRSRSVPPDFEGSRGLATADFARRHERQHPAFEKTLPRFLLGNDSAVMDGLINHNKSQALFDRETASRLANEKAFSNMCAYTAEHSKVQQTLSSTIKSTCGHATSYGAASSLRWDTN